MRVRTNTHIYSMLELPNRRPIEPIALTAWSIRETLQTRTRHFVGCAPETGIGKVSSAIISWDPSMMQGRTLSGLTYTLIGPPGFDPEAELEWNARVFRTRCEDSWRDVTAEAIQETAFAGTVIPTLICSWAIMESVSQGTRFLVGYRSGTGEPVAAGPVTSFDPKAWCVGTAEGAYRFAGLEMMGATEFELIIERFEHTNESDWIDVSEKFSDKLFEDENDQQQAPGGCGST